MYIKQLFTVITFVHLTIYMWNSSLCKNEIEMLQIAQTFNEFTKIKWVQQQQWTTLKIEKFKQTNKTLTTIDV